MLAQGLVLDALPQFSGIGWDKFFSDKEWFFHVLTYFAWKVGGGERGIQLLMPVLSSLAYIAVFFSAHRWSRDQSSRLPTLISILSVFAFVLSIKMLERTIMVRALVPVMLLTILLVDSLIRGSRFGAAVWAVFFALTYHGLFIPMSAFFFIWLPFSGAPMQSRKAAAWAVGGLLAGTLSHPSFPGNLVLGWQHLQVAFELAGEVKLRHGMEGYPPATNFLIPTAGFQIVLLLVFISKTWVTRHHAPANALIRIRWLGLMTMAFLLASLITPRAFEIFFPLAGLLAAAVLSQWSRLRPLTQLTLVLALSLNFWNVYKLLASSEPGDGLKSFETTFAAFDSLPKRESPDSELPLVVNCDWDVSPYLFYRRSDYRQLDLLDSMFLYRANRGLHELREGILNGTVLDLAGALKSEFGARYFLCRHPEVHAYFDADPRFERVFPNDKFKSTFQSLYGLRDVSRLRSVSAFEGYRLPRATDSKSRRNAVPDPRNPAWTALQLSTPDAPGIDLLRAFGDRKEDDDVTKVASVQCYWVRASSKELAKFQSPVRYLGLGGGPNVRLWINGVPTFTNSGFTLNRRISHFLIPLPAHQSVRRLEALVCREPKQPFADLVLSAWSEESLRMACETRDSSKPKSVESTTWTHTEFSRQTCLGHIALG
ncbi:MAG: hypothetical protein AAB425_10940, partial [Bdellovibrionota bacterium]